MTDAVSGNGPRWTGAPAGVPVLYYEDLEEGHERDRREVVLQVAVRDVVAPLARPHAALGPGPRGLAPTKSA